VIDPLALPDEFANRQFLVVLIGWHQHHDRLPDGLGGGVTEQSFGALVPRSNAALECLADNRVVGGRDERRDQRLLFDLAFECEVGAR